MGGQDIVEVGVRHQRPWCYMGSRSPAPWLGGHPLASTSRPQAQLPRPLREGCLAGVSSLPVLGLGLWKRLTLAGWPGSPSIQQPPDQLPGFPLPEPTWHLRHFSQHCPMAGAC